MKMKSNRAAQRLDHAPQPMLAVRQRHHLDFGAGQIAIGWDEAHRRDRVGQQKPGRLAVAEQRLVDGASRRTLSAQADAARQVALRVGVHEQHALALLGKDVARLMAVVVLPTPPFWLATAMTLATRVSFSVI